MASRAGRLLALIEALRRHRRPVTAAALADRLGVSPRTLYRDIATLVAEGAPIRGEAGLGYVLHEGFFLPPAMFTGEELDAVLLGLGLAAARGDPALADAAESVRAKLTASLPPALADAAALPVLRAAPKTTPHAVHIATVRAAIRAERRLDLAYRDAAGRNTRRIVWPLLIGVFEDSELLAAWCETRADFRHFRIDRIASATTLPDRFPGGRRRVLADWQRTHRDRPRPPPPHAADGF